MRKAEIRLAHIKYSLAYIRYSLAHFDRSFLSFYLDDSRHYRMLTYILVVLVKI